MSTQLAHITNGTCYSVQVVQYGAGEQESDPCHIQLGVNDGSSYMFCRLNHDQVRELQKALDKYQEFCYTSLRRKEDVRLNEIRQNQTC